jgi:hypothetical protein
MGCIQSTSIESNDDVNVEGNSSDKIHNDHTNELLEWHIRLGHMSMKGIQICRRDPTKDIVKM